MERWGHYNDKRESSGLQTEYARQGGATGEHAKLQGEHAKLQGELSKLQGEHAKLQGEHVKLSREHSRLHDEHSHLRDEHVKLKKDSAMLGDYYTKLHIHESKKATAALQETIEGLKLSCQSAESRASLAQQLSAERVQEMSVKSKTLEERCIGLGALAEQHRIAHARLDIEHRTLQARHSETVGAHQELQARSLAQQNSLAKDLKLLLVDCNNNNSKQLESKLGEVSKALRESQDRESKALGVIQNLKSMHKAQLEEKRAGHVEKIEKFEIPAKPDTSNRAVLLELKKASDALSFIKKGSSADTRAIREASGHLLGLQWRLLNK